MWFYSAPGAKCTLTDHLKLIILASFKTTNPIFRANMTTRTGLAYRGCRSKDIGLYELLNAKLSFSPVLYLNKNGVIKLYQKSVFVKNGFKMMMIFNLN